MRTLVGLVMAPSIVLGMLGFVLSGMSGRRVDFLKGVVVGGIPAAIGVFAMFRLRYAEKLRVTDRLAMAVACVPIAMLAFSMLQRAIRGPGAGLEVKHNPLATRTVDGPSQQPGTSSEVARPDDIVG